MGIVRIDLTEADTLLRNVRLDERGEPKIGGSVGGFIALVVCLTLVIIVASTAIIYLVRQEIRDRDALRRQRRYQHQDASDSPYIYDPSSSPPKSWLASLKGMIFNGAVSVRYNAARRMKGRDGWVQAGSGDEWDDDMRDAERLRNIDHDVQYVAYSLASDPPFRPPGNLSAEAASTAHPEPRGSHKSDPRIPNRFAFDASEPPSSGLPLSDVPIMPRSASPEAISSPIPSSVYFEPQNRKNSTNSDISTRTFSSGTKFVEGL